MKQELQKLVTDLFTPARTVPDNSRCPACTSSREYKTAVGLRNHISSKHPGLQLEALGNDTVAISEVYSHTIELLRMLILKRMLDHSIDMGDGNTIAKLIKFMMLYFTQLHCTKYALASFQFCAQQQIFLSPRMATLVRQERFVNNLGKQNTNIPVDLDVEHSNKFFKENFRVSQGEISEKVLNRISQAQDIVKETLDAFRKSFQLEFYEKQHKADPEKYLADCRKITKVLSSHNVYDKSGSAKLYSRQLAKSCIDPIQEMDMTKFRLWLLSKLTEMKDKPFYKY